MTRDTWALLSGLTSGWRSREWTADTQGERREKTGVATGRPGSFTASILVAVVPVCLGAGDL